MQEQILISDYPSIRRENIRYCDTDRQGHVNNAIFATFFEAGRVAILYDPERGLTGPEREFVIVKLVVDFKAEMAWPGQVDIGSRIKHVGRSSVVFEQAIFHNGECAATAETVMVMIDTATRKSVPFTADNASALRAASGEPTR